MSLGLIHTSRMQISVGVENVEGSMANPYATIFREPGSKSFAAAAFMARLPTTMVPIGIVTMLSQTQGSYWLAGAVAGCFAVASALVSPHISRLVDRYGQSKVLIPATALAAAALTFLILVASLALPMWTLFAAAVIAASMPSYSAMARARWGNLLRGRAELNTAFAFESALDELVYILGASLSVAMSVAVFPAAGLTLATVLLVIGGAAFVVQRSTEPPVHALATTRRRSAILQRPLQIVTLAMICVGAMFATVEVSTVALTASWGAPEMASWVISVYAAGSFVLGLILGALNPRLALHRQLLLALGVLTAASIPLLFANSVPLLAFCVFLSGIAVSPTFITAFGLIERRIPHAMLTEGVTWVTTGIGFGTALGASLVGWTVDTYGPKAGFLVTLASTFSALAIVLIGQRVLSERPTE
jgi:MFS family permease